MVITSSEFGQSSWHFLALLALYLWNVVVAFNLQCWTNIIKSVIPISHFNVCMHLVNRWVEIGCGTGNSYSAQKKAVDPNCAKTKCLTVSTLWKRCAFDWLSHIDSMCIHRLFWNRKQCIVIAMQNTDCYNMKLFYNITWHYFVESTYFLSFTQVWR